MTRSKTTESFTNKLCYADGVCVCVSRSRSISPRKSPTPDADWFGTSTPPSSSPPRPALFFSLLYLRQPMNFLSPDAVMTSVPSQSSFFFFFSFFSVSNICIHLHICTSLLSCLRLFFFFACFFFHTARFLFILKNVFLKWFQAIVFSLRPECVVCNERDGEQCGDWREKENEP